MDTSPAPTPTSHFFTSLRTRLHYLDWGNPSAPPLLLVHGGFDHGRSWDWTARALARDYHVIVPDLRGHGDSGWANDGAYPINKFVYDLAQLVDLIGRPQVTIIAHSLGGSIALRYAGLYPERVSRMVAIEALGLSPQALEQSRETPLLDSWRAFIDARRRVARRQQRHYPTIEAAIERMRERNEHLSVEQALHLTHHGVNRNEDGSYSWKFDPYLHNQPPGSSSDTELPDFWHAVTCPVLLALGLDSWASNPVKDGRAAHFRDARLVEFADAGHWLHHDQFDRFLAEVRAFLQPKPDDMAAKADRA